MHRVASRAPFRPSPVSSGVLSRVLEICGAFASNVVNRFHEHADARLDDELTVLAQRRRLLEERQADARRMGDRRITGRPGIVRES